jgi:branched-chain amino acid transport system substrate-binding protein
MSKLRHMEATRNWLVISLVGALGVAACGGGTPSGSSSKASCPVRIAEVTALTGPVSQFGIAGYEGAQAAVVGINKAGGVLGCQLVLDPTDTVGDPADAVPAFNKEIATNNPAAIDGPQSHDLFALQANIIRTGITTFIYGGVTTFDTNTSPWLYRGNPSDSVEGVAMAVYAYKKGYRKAAMMFSTAVDSQTLGAKVKDTFIKLGGTDVADVSFAESQTSYRSEALKVVNAKPDVIFIQANPPAAGPILASLRQLNNLAVPVVGSDTTAGSDWITAITPQVAHQVLTSLIGSASSGPAYSLFLSYYASLFSHAPLSGAIYNYDGVNVLALAIEKAGSTDRKAINDAILSVSNPPGTKCSTFPDCLRLIKAGTKIDYDGISGPMDFNQNHNVFGAFDAVQVGSDGNEAVLQTLSAADITAAG